MSKKKKVKLIGLDEWHIEEQEAWFSDMSKQGWKLEKLTLWTAVFVEMEPEELRYRIEIANRDKHLEEAHIQLYQDAGWEYVTSRRYIHIFREKEAGKAFELHTDPSVQAESIEILKKSIWNRGIGILLLTVLMVSLQLSSIFNLTSYDLLGDGFITSSFILILYFFLAIHIINGMVHISSLIKKLKKGIPLEHNVNYRGKVRSVKAIGLVFIIVFIMLISQSLFNRSYLNPEKAYPEIPSGKLPVVSLTDIENVQLTEVIYDENALNNRKNNFFTEDSSLLIPKQVRLRQRFAIPGKEPQGKAVQYEASIHSKKYEALSVGLAEKLIELLVDETNDSQLMKKYETDFDELWVLEENGCTIIARDGKNVFEIHYIGNQPSKVVQNNLTKLIQ